MTFSIRFTGAPDEHLDDDPNIPSAIGRIVAGELDEEFVSSLYEWNREAYERQWNDSLRQFVDGSDRAVLITWYVNPAESSNLQWWALYRVDDFVYIQNRLPWYRDLAKTFSIADAQKYLPDRQTISEYRASISEWVVPFRDVARFYGYILIPAPVVRAEY
jgi:hypothetical protein